MRLNLRLTDELRRRLLALERTTGQSRSDTVRAAPERSFAETPAPGRSVHDAIHASGLVGCGEAETDLSGSYESRLRESLERTHGHR